jgi:transcriptional regulator with XRE-family HTH domain
VFVLVKTLGTNQHKALVAALIVAREAAGMTQTQLADALGEYQSFVARLESGERRIDVIEFIRLSRVIGFNAEEILRKISGISEH